MKIIISHSTRSKISRSAFQTQCNLTEKLCANLLPKVSVLCKVTLKRKLGYTKYVYGRYSHS